MSRIGAKASGNEYFKSGAFQVQTRSVNGAGLRLGAGSDDLDSGLAAGFGGRGFGFGFGSGFDFGAFDLVGLEAVEQCGLPWWLPQPSQ